MSGFNVIESKTGLIKAWTQGVPIEESALKQLRNVASRHHFHEGSPARRRQSRSNR